MCLNLYQGNGQVYDADRVYVLNTQVFLLYQYWLTYNVSVVNHWPASLFGLINRLLITYVDQSMCSSEYLTKAIQYKTLFHSNHIKWTHEFTCTMQHIAIGDKV